jgi:hypothetical protein
LGQKRKKMTVRTHAERLRKVKSNIKYKEIFSVSRITSDEQRRDQGYTDSYYTASGGGGGGGAQQNNR